MYVFEILKNEEADYLKRHPEIIESDEVTKAYDLAIELLKQQKSGKLIVLPFGVGDTAYKVAYPRGSNMLQVIAECVQSIPQALNVAFSPKFYFQNYEEALNFISTCYNERKE